MYLWRTLVLRYGWIDSLVVVCFSATDKKQKTGNEDEEADCEKAKEKMVKAVVALRRRKENP